jgi:hypothetical protein
MYKSNNISKYLKNHKGQIFPLEKANVVLQEIREKLNKLTLKNIEIESGFINLLLGKDNAWELKEIKEEVMENYSSLKRLEELFSTANQHINSTIALKLTADEDLLGLDKAENAWNQFVKEAQDHNIVISTQLIKVTKEIRRIEKGEKPFYTSSSTTMQVEETLGRNIASLTTNVTKVTEKNFSPPLSSNNFFSPPQGVQDTPPTEKCSSN